MAVSVATLSSVIFVGVAFTEGEWESHVSGVLPEFASRTWQDNFLDAQSSTTYFQGCNLRYSNLSSVDMGL
ncbi:hypothetical protein [Rothia nasimurium]|uniref:hypothetical protein n=1 Tax=Rothia nasimurium TaxID=85336 RepID=UPI003BA13817